MEAKSEIITTASYQASIPGFVDHLNVTDKEAVQLMTLSVSLAREAADEYYKEIGEKGNTDIYMMVFYVCVLCVFVYMKIHINTHTDTTPIFPNSWFQSLSGLFVFLDQNMRPSEIVPKLQFEKKEIVVIFLMFKMPSITLWQL